MLCLKMTTWNLLSHFCWKRQNWQNKASKNIHLASIRSQFIFCCHVQSMQNKRRKRQTLGWSVLFHTYIKMSGRYVSVLPASSHPGRAGGRETPASQSTWCNMSQSKCSNRDSHVTISPRDHADLLNWHFGNGSKASFYTNYLLYSKW